MHGKPIDRPWLCHETRTYSSKKKRGANIGLHRSWKSWKIIYQAEKSWNSDVGPGKLQEV